MTALMTGLLFLAFAFFTVAKAGSVRNGGQSAADSAALAAAQDDRDQLFDGFLDALDEGDEDAWQDWLDGIGDLTGDGCGEAEHFAGRNRSDVVSCEQITRGGDDGYTVGIETRFDTGSSIIPGTENRTAQAEATAVIKPLCDVEGAPGGAAAAEVEIICDGEEFTIDPDDEDSALEPSDLFSVVLVG